LTIDLENKNQNISILNDNIVNLTNELNETLGRSDDLNNLINLLEEKLRFKEEEINIKDHENNILKEKLFE
jgi:hypothetical protein